MIGISVNPHSVHIPIIQTGCYTAEFDSTYPIHLNGIISQHEFEKSINRINRQISSSKIIIYFAVIFGLFTIGGITCLAVSTIIGPSSYRNVFPSIISGGFSLFIFGLLLCVVASLVVQFQRVRRLRDVVATVSKKYSSRSPIPCGWRLVMPGNFIGGSNNRHQRQAVCHLVIDIGQPIVQRTPASALALEYQDNCSPPPPPYSSLPTGFCFQCHVPRQDLLAKFCSSCGYSFHHVK